MYCTQYELCTELILNWHIGIYPADKHHPSLITCVTNDNENIKYENDNQNIKYENCVVMWYGPPNIPRGVSVRRADRSPAGHHLDVKNK